MTTIAKAAKGHANKKTKSAPAGTEKQPAIAPAPRLPGWEPEDHREDINQGWPWVADDAWEVLAAIMKHHGEAAISCRSAVLTASPPLGPDKLKHIARADKAAMIAAGVDMVAEMCLAWHGMLASWNDDLCEAWNKAKGEDEKWGVILVFAANMRAVYDEMTAACRARAPRMLASPPEPSAPGAPLASMWGRTWNPAPPLA